MLGYCISQHILNASTYMVQDSNCSIKSQLQTTELYSYCIFCILLSSTSTPFGHPSSWISEASKS